MEKEGWIKIHRGIMDSSLYFAEPFTKSAAWIDLLLLANHKEGRFFVRGVEVKVLRGQVGYSQVKLAERWKWGRKKVDNYLKYLEKEQQIIVNKSFVNQTITILNYEKYQSKEQQTSSRGTAEEQQRNSRGTLTRIKRMTRI